MDTMETPSAESSLQLVLKKNNANKYCSSKGVDLKLCSLILKKTQLLSSCTSSHCPCGQAIGKRVVLVRRLK